MITDFFMELALMHHQKHIATALSLLWLCIFSSQAFASESDASKNSTPENYYLLRDTGQTFTLSSCTSSELSDDQQSGSDSCFAEAFTLEDEQLLAQDFTEVYNSAAAVLPVTGAALLGAAGSWSKHLHWLPKTALTKWALSLAGGAVVVGYLAEKFAASEGVLLSSSSAGNNEYNNLATSNGEDLLGSSSSPDPKPVPPPVVSTGTDDQRETYATLTESDTTPLFENVDDEIFEALLNKYSIKAEDYQRFKDAVILKAIKSLHIPGDFQGDKKINFFRSLLQKKGSSLSIEEQNHNLEDQYIIDASYYLLADILKLIKNGTLVEFQGLNLVKDGYALYTRPLLVNIAAQLPSILKEACASPGLNQLKFSDCLELYNRALLEDPSPFKGDSAAKWKDSLGSKYASSNFETGSISDPVWMKLTLHSVITSKIEALGSAYVADVKRLLSMINALHDDWILFFFKTSSVSEFMSRVSRTRILEGLVTDPSQYLKDNPQEAIFNANIYKNPQFQENMSDCLKANQLYIFDCR
ncbi:MAG: hypothetical protein OXC44_08145 [Proteobacteria bacterium]|nr:hypothetical protein [Pseudomonadota bacterium]